MYPLKNKALFGIGALVGLTLVDAVAAPRVIVNETFNYASEADLRANWGNSPSLSLNTESGNPSPSASHTGVAPGTGNVNLIRWTGAFELTPSDAEPVVLTADIFSSGNRNQANTIGLRQNGGISPLFEMGSYRLFDNDPNGAIATADGHGVRTLNIAVDLPGQDWVKFGDNYTGWARWEATFTSLSAIVRVDYEIDGIWDFTYTETGTTPIGTFGDLRIHSPVASNGGGFSVDNIRLEVIPEPSTVALSMFGAAALYFMRRRKN